MWTCGVVLTATMQMIHRCALQGGVDRPAADQTSVPSLATKRKVTNTTTGNCGHCDHVGFVRIWNGEAICYCCANILAPRGEGGEKDSLTGQDVSVTTGTADNTSPQRGLYSSSRRQGLGSPRPVTFNLVVEENGENNGVCEPSVSVLRGWTEVWANFQPSSRVST